MSVEEALRALRSARGRMAYYRRLYREKKISLAELRPRILEYARAVRAYGLLIGEADFKTFLKEHGLSLLARHEGIRFLIKDMDEAVTALTELHKTGTKGTQSAWHGIRGVIYQTYESTKRKGLFSAWKLNLREGWVEDYERLPEKDEIDRWLSVRTQILMSNLYYSNLAETYDRFYKEKAHYRTIGGIHG